MSEENVIIHLCFRFVGEEIDPEYISKVLCIIPDQIHFKGDKRDDNPNYTYPYGCWIIDSKLSDDFPLRDHIKSILEVLLPKQDQIQKLIDKGYKPEFYCSAFCNQNSSIIIDCETMEKLSFLGIPILQCIYNEDG